MTILFVIDRYFPFGGLQQDMLRLAQTVVQRGHTVTILLGSWQGPKPGHQSIQVHEVSLNAWTNDGRIRQLAQHVRRAKEAMDFDVIVGFKKMPGLDVYFAGDSCFAAMLRRTKPGLARWLPRYRAYLADEQAVFGPQEQTELLLLSPKQLEEFHAHYHTPTYRMHVLPPGIDRDRLAVSQTRQTLRREIRDELGLSEATTLLLSVGSSFRTKGVDRAIRGLRWVTDQVDSASSPHLVVIGQGKAGPMQKLAKRSGVDKQVHLLGGRDDVPRFFHAADLLVHPARVENTGTVLLEALICGVPAIVSGVCGFASYITEAKAGRVVAEPFDQRAFDQRLAEGLDAAERHAWSTNAQHYAQAHRLSGMVDQAVDVILQRGADERA